MRALTLSFLCFAGCTSVNLDEGYRFLCTRGGPTTECRGAFHCGLENRCLPDAPGPWQCADDTDCFGWHCGVARTCYDLTTATSVACRDDRDCATGSGWRCDPDARCVQTAQEALRPASPLVVMEKDLTPQLWTRTPRLVSVGNRNEAACNFGNVLTVDLVDSVGLTRVEMPQFLPGSCDAGTRRYEVALPTTPRAIASVDAATWVLGSPGSITRYVWPNTTATLIRGTQVPPFNLRELKQLGTAAVAFGDDGLSLLTETGASDAVFSSPVRDVIEVASMDGGTELLVATDQGLKQGIPGGTFRTPGDGSPCSTLFAKRLDFSDYPTRGFTVLNENGFGSQYLMKFTHIDGGADAYPYCLPELPAGQAWHSEVLLTQYLNDCELAGWADTYDGGQRVLCRVDGGYVDRGNSEELLKAPAVSTTGTTYFADKWPQLRVLGPAGLVPMISNQAPRAIAVTDAGVLGFNVDPALTTWLADTAAQNFSPLFVSAVEVSGRPSWVAGNASSTSGVYDVERILRYDTRPLLVLPVGSTPTAAAVETNGDGGTRYIVAIGDTVRFSEGGSLNLAFVAAPQSAITSIAPVADALGARFAGGYVVASGRIYRYRAENAVVWRTDELVVNDDEVVEVLADGVRARVALRTGAIFSLPSRVQLAPPTSAPASDFVQRCEHTFALTTAGLEHLVSDGSTLGRWERLITHAGGGRLFSADQRLLIFWSNGLISELNVPCTR
jgi:hypothetical protein